MVLCLAINYGGRTEIVDAVRTIAEALPPCAHVDHARFVLFDIATCKAYVRAADKISRESLAISVIFTTGPS